MEKVEQIENEIFWRDQPKTTIADDDLGFFQDEDWILLEDDIIEIDDIFWETQRGWVSFANLKWLTPPWLFSGFLPIPNIK